jgi:hypothetical protein
MKKGIITIAMGKEYADYAKLLALCLHHHANDYPLAVLTDVEASYYDDLFDVVIPVPATEPFRTDPFFLKLRLFDYSPYDQTLFLDADTVVFDNLEVVWNHIAYCNQSFFSYGYTARGGVQYEAPAELLLKIFKTSFINCHNGGLYYFDKSVRAARIFDIARKAISRFDSLFPHTNGRTGHVSDELLLAYGMSKFNYQTLRAEIIGNKWAYAPLLPVTEGFSYDFEQNSCKVKYSFSSSWYEPVVLHYSANPIITKQKLYTDLSSVLKGVAKR